MDASRSRHGSAGSPLPVAAAAGFGIRKPGVESGGLEARSAAAAPGNVLVRNGGGAPVTDGATVEGDEAAVVEDAGTEADESGGGRVALAAPNAGRVPGLDPSAPDGGRCDADAPAFGSIGARGVKPGGAVEGRAEATACVRVGASSAGFVGVSSSPSSLAIVTGEE